jgi:hypothetical protein
VDRGGKVEATRSDVDWRCGVSALVVQDVAALLKVKEASYRKGRGRKKAQEKGGNR